MLTVDDYGAIRRARRDGRSIRQIARELGLSRITVRKALKQPGPVAKVRDRPAPKLGPVQTTIDQILTDDEEAPPKQRHTAAQVYRRLRDEFGYLGGYAQVQRYVDNGVTTPALAIVGAGPDLRRTVRDLAPTS